MRRGDDTAPGVEASWVLSADSGVLEVEPESSQLVLVEFELSL